jgi:hypothetical protein
MEMGCCSDLMMSEKLPQETMSLSIGEYLWLRLSLGLLFKVKLKLVSLSVYCILAGTWS